jgi:hypothetical protein
MVMTPDHLGFYPPEAICQHDKNLQGLSSMDAGRLAENPVKDKDLRSRTL